MLLVVATSSSSSPQSTGWTALFFAAEAGDVATTQSLIRAGANVHIKDKVWWELNQWPLCIWTIVMCQVAVSNIYRFANHFSDMNYATDRGELGGIIYIYVPGCLLFEKAVAMILFSPHSSSPSFPLPGITGWFDTTGCCFWQW